MPTTMYSKSSSPSKAALTTCLMSCLLIVFLREYQVLVGDAGSHGGDGEDQESKLFEAERLGAVVMGEPSDAVLVRVSVLRDNEGEVVRGIGVGLHLGQVDRLVTHGIPPSGQAGSWLPDATAPVRAGRPAQRRCCSCDRGRCRTPGSRSTGSRWSAWS